jgi:cobyrinic acid a,c-diamide synthase
MKLPRILLAAPASGSGKTVITGGILMALKQRGHRLAAFKCGPDYIDPMFHSKLLGVPAKNLDTFFTTPELTKYLFATTAQAVELSVMEGVMGYYDGIAGTTTKASAYELALITATPVVLVVNAKGMSLSLLPLIQGFLQFRKDSNIVGVILNRISPMLYERIKTEIEAALPVKVLGFVPEAAEFKMESRHLGLKMPHEIENFKEKLTAQGELIAKTVDLEGLLALSVQAPPLTCQKPDLGQMQLTKPVRIGIARDEAFCFIYQDNLELMEKMGAQLVFFSPLADKHLPNNLDGLIFYGGYPELYAAQLSENQTMLTDIRLQIANGIPYLAECGGFLYLHERLKDFADLSYPMVGAVSGAAFPTKKLSRFGYLELTAAHDQILGTAGSKWKGHEFHYYDSTNNGSSFVGKKPVRHNEFTCMHGNMQRGVGFPHLYYYSNPSGIYQFLKTCLKRGQKHGTN